MWMKREIDENHHKLTSTYIPLALKHFKVKGRDAGRGGGGGGGGGGEGGEGGEGRGVLRSISRVLFKIFYMKHTHIHTHTHTHTHTLSLSERERERHRDKKIRKA